MAYSHDISKISVNDNMPRNSTGYTRCPKKNWELLLVIVAVTPSFFWDTLYLGALMTWNKKNIIISTIMSYIV